MILQLHGGNFGGAPATDVGTERNQNFVFIILIQQLAGQPKGEVPGSIHPVVERGILTCVISDGCGLGGDLHPIFQKKVFVILIYIYRTRWS